MRNALVHLSYHLNLPERVVQEILDRTILRPDDGSDSWHQSALDAVENAVRDNPAHYMDHVSDEPDIEVDG